MTATLVKELAFVKELCGTTGDIAMRYFNQGDIVSQVKDKADGTPVTRADKEIERYIRDAVSRDFPLDIILGEEESKAEELQVKSSKRRWIIDPIDGTFNYARGIPIFSTLIALEENGDIILGVIHNPALGDLYYATKGGGAFKNDKRLSVSAISDLSKSMLNYGSPKRLLELGYWPKLTDLIGRTARQGGFGDYLSFAFVLEGKAEASIEVGLKPWDLAPMKILVEEAGGVFFDFEGGQSVFQGSCVIANQGIGKTLREFLLS